MPRKLALAFVSLVPALLHATSPTSITLSSSTVTAQYGSPVTFTASVTPAAATGKVTFLQGALLLETVPLTNGVASFTTTLLPFGTETITASYLGDSTYSRSTSAPVTETIQTVKSRGFTSPVHFPSPAAYGSLTVGDFNSDGRLDIAAASTQSESLQVFLGNGDGSFQTAISFAYADASGPIATGDFNGDGLPDLVIASAKSSTVSVFLGNGDGTFQPAVTSATNYPSTAIAIGDFNADGKPDLAIIRANNTVDGFVVLLGNGDGSFRGPVLEGRTFSYFPSIAVGDLNGDGKPDILAAARLMSGSYEHGVNAFLGNGDGSFQPAIHTALLAEASDLTVADFNNDGIADLAAVIYGNTFAVLLGNGDGTFQPAVYRNVGLTLGSLVVSDFNADGKADLLFADSGSGNSAVIVCLGNGDGTFQEPVGYSTGVPGGAAPVSADFNRDGRPDFADLSGGTLNIQSGSPAAPTSAEITSSVNPSLFGFPVTLTAAITPSTVHGTVVFSSDKVGELGKAVVRNGSAILTLSTLQLGLQNLSAMYVGTDSELPSTSRTIAQTVNPAPTSTTLLCRPNPSAVGQTVSLIAAITPSSATGDVSFFEGSSIIGTAPISSGTAILQTSTLAAGTHKMTATYLGTVDFNPSVSFIVRLVVQ